MFAIDKTENKRIETVLPCQAAPFLFNIKSAYFDVNPTLPKALNPTVGDNDAAGIHPRHLVFLAAPVFALLLFSRCVC